MVAVGEETLVAMGEETVMNVGEETLMKAGSGLGRHMCSMQVIERIVQRCACI